MAMSVGGDSTEEKPMSDINTTPLVDVMLVLLIIFLIAIPVVVQSVEVELPEVLFEPTTTKPENVSLSIRGNASGCEVFWGMTQVGAGELLERGVTKLKADIERQGGIGNPNLELPEVHIRGDVNTPYRCIGGTIYTMQSAGYAKVGFISEPAPGSTVTKRL
ncbi:ExbD/TolR family protein [Sphingomonas japonica]|uniref:Biopolymer transport protein ExbD n=1 Tax=Sphingomonas japonica TaxID=511662 RepID=A0ABX0U5H2_9SPHN|nr:biopolymer transporter ExbD [Sphingomonas japonica]NIJ24507.1 biopolymer transport protein ExbD [Sphingomonas japonica]